MHFPLSGNDPTFRYARLDEASFRTASLVPISSIANSRLRGAPIKARTWSTVPLAAMPTPVVRRGTGRSHLPAQRLGAVCR